MDTKSAGGAGRAPGDCCWAKYWAAAAMAAANLAFFCLICTFCGLKTAGFPNGFP